MGKPNWLQRTLKFLGVPTALTQYVSNVQRQGILNRSFYGINPQWESGFADGITAYSHSATLYAVINRITKTAAIAPWKVYRVKDKKKHYNYKQWTGENATTESLQKAMQIKELVYEEDLNHPLNKIIDNPNEWCKGSEFVINAIGFKLLKGNRYIRIITLKEGANAGRPYEIELLPPQFVTIKTDGSLYGVEGYWLRMGGYEEFIPADQIVHSKDFNPNYDNMGSHLYGLSKIEVASKNLQRGDSGLNRSVAMLDNAGAAGILYDETGDDDTTSLDYNNALKRKVNDEILGTDNSGRIAVANKKLGYINFALSAVEMNILELEKYSQEQICNIFGVPPGLLNPDKMSLNNAREFKKELLTSAVTPLLSELRDDWNDIASRYKDNDLYVDYDISAYPELQEDMDKVVSRLSNMWWLKGDEKRLASGYDQDPSEPMMQQYLVPSGLTPISELGNNTDQLLGQMTVDNGDVNKP